MGGRPCAKAILDQGIFASEASKLSILANATALSFTEMYNAGELTEEQVAAAMELSYDMCEWAEWLEPRTAKLKKFYVDLVGTELDGEYKKPTTSDGVDAHHGEGG
jgi:hypothetical protein